MGYGELEAVHWQLNKLKIATTLLFFPSPPALPPTPGEAWGTSCCDQENSSGTAQEGNVCANGTQSADLKELIVVEESGFGHTAFHLVNKV